VIVKPKKCYIGFRVGFKFITWGGKRRQLENVTVFLNPQNTLKCNSMQAKIRLFLDELRFYNYITYAYFWTFCVCFGFCLRRNCFCV